MTIDERAKLLNDIERSRPVMDRIGIAERKMKRYLQIKRFVKRLMLVAAVPFAIGLLMLTAGVLRAIQQSRTEDIPAVIGIGMILAAPMILCILCMPVTNKMMKTTMSELRQLRKDPLLAWLPAAYRYPLAYDHFRKCIAEGRAGSVAEAVVLYTADPSVSFIRAVTLGSALKGM